jgi:hypothetical protein
MNHPKKIDAVNQKELMKKTDAIIKIGAITIGTQLGTSVIHKLAKHPVFLFGLGMVAGIYINKNRKQILASAQYLAQQGKEFIIKADTEEEE